MPYTIVYTEAPRCAYCGRPMASWIAFAEVHYHDECQARLFSEHLQAKLQLVVDSFKQREPRWQSPRA